MWLCSEDSSPLDQGWINSKALGWLLHNRSLFSTTCMLLIFSWTTGVCYCVIQLVMGIKKKKKMCEYRRFYCVHIWRMYGIDRRTLKCPKGKVNSFITDSAPFLVCIERHLYIKQFSTVIDVSVCHLEWDRHEHHLVNFFAPCSIWK